METKDPLPTCEVDEVVGVVIGRGSTAAGPGWAVLRNGSAQAVVVVHAHVAGTVVEAA